MFYFYINITYHYFNISKLLSWDIFFLLLGQHLYQILTDLVSLSTKFRIYWIQSQVSESSDY